MKRSLIRAAFISTFHTALLGAALCTVGCATARLEPSSADQKVPGKPNAAATEIADGVRIQVEANAWMADDRVKNEVTAMKVTLVNRGSARKLINYDDFSLVSDGGKRFAPVDPKDIPIRGAARSIGLPADTIITRSSDSSVNAPNRELSEKEQLRKRLNDQALKSGDIPAGERTVGYIYFERVPSSVSGITFQGVVKSEKTNQPLRKIELTFRPRQFQ